MKHLKKFEKSDGFVCDKCKEPKSFWELHKTPVKSIGFRDKEYTTDKDFCEDCLGWKKDKSNWTKNDDGSYSGVITKGIENLKKEAINNVQLFIEDLKQKGFSDEEIEKEVRKFKEISTDETGSHNGFMW